MTSPGILAVIPCLNEEQHLERLAAKVLAAPAPLPLRIVIADGGSTDRSPDIAKKLAAQHANVLVLNNQKRLQSAGINLAVSTFGAEDTYLIRLDAHADYPENYIQTLVEEAERTKAASVVVAMHTAGHGGFQDAVAAAQNSRLGTGGSAHRSATQDGKWADHGHHALMRIEAFREIGGYDETFSHNEDAELDIRLRKAGYKIWLTGKTFLTYYPRDGGGAVSAILQLRRRPRAHAPQTPRASETAPASAAGRDARHSAGVVFAVVGHYGAPAVDLDRVLFRLRRPARAQSQRLEIIVGRRRRDDYSCRLVVRVLGEDDKIRRGW